MATYDEGVLEFNGGDLTQHFVYEKDKVVNCFTVYADHQHNLWLGTINAGLYNYDGNTFEKFNVE